MKVYTGYYVKVYSIPYFERYIKGFSILLVMFRQSWFHFCSVNVCTGHYIIFHAIPSCDRYVTVYDIGWGVTSKLIKIAHTYCDWCCKYYTQTVIRHCHLINTSYPAYSVITWLWWHNRQHYRCHLN